MLARAPPGSTQVALVAFSEGRDSVDASADAIVGDEGCDSRKRSSGNCCTRLITLLTTLRSSDLEKTGAAEKERTHFDKAVGGITIPQVPDGEALAVGDLLHVYGEKGDGMFLGTLVGGVERVDVGVYRDWGAGGGEEIEEVAQRDTEGEDVP